MDTNLGDALSGLLLLGSDSNNDAEGVYLRWECRIFKCQKMVKSTDTCVLARHVTNMLANMLAA